MLKKLIFVYFLFLFVNGNVFSQSQDSVCFKNIRDYHKKYFKNPADPIILTASDTLLMMARKCRDQQMERIALGAKLDYYYYYNQDDHRTDSIIAWVDRMKDYAKSIGDEQLYYWAWSSRLINHYLKLGEYNIALVEANKMLKEAQSGKYKENIADCYSTLANIYSAKGLMKKAQEFMLKEIDIFEKYELNRYHISFQYSDAAKIYIEQDEPEKASGLLEKAVLYARIPYHLVTAKLTYVLNYLAEKELNAARKELDECRQMFKDEPSIQRHIHYLYEIEITFYKKTGKYEDALKVLEMRRTELENKNELISLTILDKLKADIYWEMNRKEEAAYLYKNYLEQQKQEKEKNEEIATGEFAALLNIQKLNDEKKELEILTQEKQLQNIRITVLFLVVLLCAISLFLYHQRRLNYKLKKSRDELNEKNRILLLAEDELRKAKELAEQNSWMKTVFIQNMSHEIRTPLNSIVGFSAVLADMFSEKNEEVKSYASLIEENSQLLLKLINDILDISALDNNPDVSISPTNINKCCLRSIDNTKLLFNDQVKLTFDLSYQEIVIMSNEEYIVQVLSNLLNNAAKFTKEGTVNITYEMRENEKQIAFIITDTGIGIPSEKQEYVFERFFKLDDFSQGTGLGLSISRMMAERLGGSLVIDKEYAQGTRFIFTVAM